MEDAPVLVESRQGYRVITLNRPSRLNSFNEAMHLALRAALVEAEGDKSCRSVLLTGAGRGFCAGQDLSDRVMGEGAEPPDLGRTIETLYSPLVRQLRALPMPIVCAVNGVAAGAGANIALACDIVLAARSATFLEAFARIGLIPDAGGTYFLPRLAGEARARGMTFLAEPVPADTAANWGLIWKSVDDNALMGESHAICARFAESATQGLALAKQALNASLANTLDEQLALERDLQREAGRTDDYAEGVRAFIEKRKANFKGRP
ncbi:MAG: 2-(1,2-epoxy-1,2-dihydrophenyl)acetyl-CoA isomerase [Hyphomicrobiales bacterium]|nr:2-(1,2-epoxy-1,2-dihydrophenyl)acetyl-CoA isomerase [Hyphomicrobiales bacterium]